MSGKLVCKFQEFRTLYELWRLNKAGVFKLTFASELILRCEVGNHMVVLTRLYFLLHHVKCGGLLKQCPFVFGLDFNIK